MKLFKSSFRHTLNKENYDDVSLPDKVQNMFYEKLLIILILCSSPVNR